MKIIDQIIFRTPLFPISHLQNNLSLDTLKENPELNEAIYIASPSFYKELHKGKVEKNNKERQVLKLEITTYKYFSRASSRCTPFGLFAGLNTAKWGTVNSIIIDSNLHRVVNRKTRLDMNVVCYLAQELSKLTFIKPHLRLYPNKSLYKKGDFYRYVEYYYQGTRRIHKLNKVNHSEYLEEIFKTAISGKCISELVFQLTKDNEISTSEASGFIEELISEQLLVNELEPTVTGKDFFESIIDLLNFVYSKQNNSELHRIIQLLVEIRELINELDVNKINKIENYQLILGKLKIILPNIDEINLFQVDLFKCIENPILDNNIQENINQAIQFFNKITPKHTNQNLEDFKKRFKERYEEEEIPLLDALDIETGIGYPNKDLTGINNFLDDILINGNNKESDSIKWNDLQATLFQILIKSIKKNRYKIEITDKDFEKIDFTSKKIPHSLSVMFSILNADTNKVCIEQVGGSSAINLLGRFANGNNEIFDVIKAVSEHEKKQVGEGILAEIVHLPESRTGNILSRPTIRDYEIPYLAKSSLNDKYQLLPEDLYISVKNNNIFIRSKKLDKEIIPRLGNAHNFYYNSLPVYHFLCDMQLQYFEKPFMSFNWGVLSNQFTFLPRVEYKNVIISPAKWQLKKEDFNCLIKKQAESEVLHSFSLFKERHKLPEVFLLVEDDNELLIDVKKNIAIYTFIDAIKQKQKVTIKEFLFDNEAPLVKDTNGNNFTNECIAVILNHENKLPTAEFLRRNEIESKRNFIIGSEWLYYKFYCGVKTADNLLIEVIKPLTEKIIQNKWADKFFFIRYTDPDTHIRLRFHVPNTIYIGQIIATINDYINSYIEQGIMFKIQMDIYKRELERYGLNSIELAESFFYIDSITTLNLLDLIRDRTEDKIRWQFALISIDELLNNFNYNIYEKYAFLKDFKDAYFQEHGGNKEFKIQLDFKYRNSRKQVEDILNYKLERKNDASLVIELLRWKRKEIISIVEEISELKSKNKLQMPLNDLISSYIHMMVNRIFKARQRTFEMVIYDLLYRHYKSKIAKDIKPTKM